MTTSINLIIDECSMGESSESATTAFISELSAAISAEYPDAAVSVEIGSYSNLSVSSSDDNQPVVDNVNAIQNNIWENGNWHYAE